MAADGIFLKDHVILDACVVINLYASGRMRDILQSISCKVALASYVKEKEALSTVGHVDGDLQAYIDCGLLESVQLEVEQEEEDFVNFVFLKLDEGEAYTGAIGVNRDWTIATDEKLATRIFKELVPPLHVLTTLDIVKYWVDTTNPAKDEIYVVLKNIRELASFVPSKTHPLYGWWENFIKA